MTIEETYQNWRSSLKKPDDSIFYYHKSLDRILLSLAIFVIASKPIVKKLGKAEMLGVLHLQVPDLITYWIDGDEEGFQTLFPMVMTVSEGLTRVARAAENRWPESKRAIRTLIYLLCHSCGAGGDMNDRLAESFLDDIETDGREIYCDKINKYGENLILLTRKYGMDIPMQDWNCLNGWG